LINANTSFSSSHISHMDIPINIRKSMDATIEIKNGLEQVLPTPENQKNSTMQGAKPYDRRSLSSDK
jgi:hypothetical protein